MFGISLFQHPDSRNGGVFCDITVPSDNATRYVTGSGKTLCPVQKSIIRYEHV